MKTLPEIWKCGGGTQSMAIAVLIIQGRLPKPDYSLIVDTGREKQSTWDYYDNVSRPALAAIGVELVRVSKEEFATVDLWSTKGTTLLIPAFSSQTEGERGKFSSWCSGEWKTAVGERYLRSIGVKKGRNWIGYSLDEKRRWASKIDKPEFRLPLVVDIPMNRAEAIRTVELFGWPKPPRSACFMCPNQDNEEWMETKTNRPNEFLESVALEKMVQEKDPHVWLHQTMVPLDQVEFEKPQTQTELQCASGECFI